ncbi:D-citramalate synthase [Parabacteroides sp. PFB2-12]|uniref:alpha-isopropylmalate synthase regulatory domain-containing protein n=1 Tax=unclassified Parabacteroides TaxID=2649774 RepID=UPI0024767115|nr:MULTISPECIES: alpha-isopropylmalate synthase regulatory domain-containing protein [unclassified Parabacteroides]MDH6342375.1 D-citramalate synthase [Parabacteroides sp. PM6-13]MDH6390718.1 D-citramalate synthase [Parabacteroides sp. PFB2-12]
MIEIMDTTLRDGEQTTGVSFAAHEKLSIAQMLLSELGVNRIEIASARVSDGEFEGVKRVAQWAARTGHLDKLEVLGFVDGDQSLNWIERAGCRVVNLLCKGSYKHVTEQLHRTPEEHIADIRRVIEIATQKKISVNIYLEDWSNGMKHSPEYVFQLLDGLKDLPVKRFMLPDTLGILNPEDTYDYCHKMVNHYPELRFDYHAHNDYDLATGNVYGAVRAGIKGIHTTVNGLGERAGNAPLSSVIAVIKDQLGEETTIREEKINKVSRLVETYAGVHIAPNKPIIGEFVFTQCAGIHADGDNKNNLYYNDLLPERFGRVREYALGKTSGKANIRKNLEALGMDMDDESMRKVTERIIALGDKKEMVTQDDLPYIVSDVLNQPTMEDEKIRILNYSLSLAQGLRPVATVKMEINGEAYEESSSGDGQYDAFVRAVRKIYTDLGRPFPMLTNYSVSIPPGGRTDAFVLTIISWNYAGVDFKTRGLDVDQTESAIKATLKMLNKIEN